ncbi:MAG: NADH-ubiquinone oxidoreductase-F iron-sulfur binding region domain-containing protein [Chloroflexota bacterium]|nr:NADH-ubiquinone oxidoreductase-F iron-sulfur binding region domain-containing protein [Chloroflexota bacterium]
MPRFNSATDLERFRQELRARSAGRRVVSVTNGTDGRTRHSQAVIRAFEEEITKQGLKEKIKVKGTGCHGFCEKEPIVVIFPEETCYVSVKPEDVPEIVSKTLVKGEVVARLLYSPDSDAGRRVVKESEIPFYKSQARIVLGNNRFVDMESIDDYIALGGYSALARAIWEMTPDLVLAEVKKANLRGRGGGGFPAGIKWETTRNAPGTIKYVVVNADEGDPGAYMDRSVLEGNPHSVLEGLIIGAYAIGSHQGFVYVRQEYPLAVENLTLAIQRAREHGLLGPDILGSGFDFDVRVHRGAGAFVSGESSALMTAIEGKVGEPRPKYIRTSVSGIWGRPSNLNNVETWATMPLIINRGADWFRSIGTEGSKGTKIFSLVGKVRNIGLVEVPMGITLREIVFDIGGGIPEGKRFKAVQTGGPSGGCIPEQYLDLPVDFDELSKVGSMMGSGGLIVMDEDNCMVDVARYFINFLTEESCGKCVPCREGLRQMREILVKITQGKGTEDDLKLLERLSPAVRDGSLCGLGQSAPNPVLTTIQYFRDEYRAHIVEKRCPAAVCKDLIRYTIIDEKCPGCSLCIKPCPVNAITFQGKKNPVVIDQSKCTKCGACYDVCRLGAVKVE